MTKMWSQMQGSALEIMEPLENYMATTNKISDTPSFPFTLNLDYWKLQLPLTTLTNNQPE